MPDDTGEGLIAIFEQVASMASRSKTAYASLQDTSQDTIRKLQAELAATLEQKSVWHEKMRYGRDILDSIKIIKA